MIIKIDGNNRIEIDEGVKVIGNIGTIKLLSPNLKRTKEYFLNKFLKDEYSNDLNNYKKNVKENVFKIDNLFDMFDFLKEDVISYNIKDYIDTSLKGDDLKYSAMLGNDHESAVNNIIDEIGYWAFMGDCHEFRYYENDVVYYLVLEMEAL